MNRLIILVSLGLSNLITTTGLLQCETNKEKEVICINYNNSENILRKSFIPDRETKGITLRNCNINNVENDAFKNNFDLQYIDLSINKITELKFSVLEDNTHVKYLNLSHNKLTTLEHGVFQSNDNLEVLDLKDNKLDSLPVGIFDFLYNLTYLDLSRNLLVGEVMNSEIFNDLTKTKFLDLSRNDLSGTPETIFSSFSVLDTLYLHKCLLDEVPNFVTRSNLKTITNLDLSTNHIAKLVHKGIFENLYNLEILNLGANVIDEIDEIVFLPLRNLKTLILRKNRLEILANNLFQSLKSLAFLDLSYNDIEFIPVDAFQGTSLKNLNLEYNRFTFLESSFSSKLRHFGVILDVFYFNDNPWQCACLNEIILEAKQYNIRYKSVKYNGFHPVCVTTREFVCKREENDNSYFINKYQNDILIDK